MKTMDNFSIISSDFSPITSTLLWGLYGVPKFKGLVWRKYNPKNIGMRVRGESSYKNKLYVMKYKNLQHVHIDLNLYI